MKKSTFRKVCIVYAVVLLGLMILTLINYSSLPAIIPIRWGSGGVVTGDIAKNLYLLSVAMLLIGVGLIIKLTGGDAIKDKSKSDNLILVIAIGLMILALTYILFKAI